MRTLVRVLVWALLLAGALITYAVIIGRLP
jgi:hypothetical protein